MDYAAKKFYNKVDFWCQGISMSYKNVKIYTLIMRRCNY